MSDEKQGSYLKINSENFNIELEGDPDFILSSYDTIRESVLKRLIELIQSGAIVPGETSAQPSINIHQSQYQQQRQGVPVSNRRAEAPIRGGGVVARNTAPAGQPSTSTTSKLQRKVADEAYIWVYVTHDIYNKVYVIDMDAFVASSINRFLDGRRMRKIYLDQTHQEFLRPLLGTGKTLWSELTPKGRETIAGTGNDS